MMKRTDIVITSIIYIMNDVIALEHFCMFTAERHGTSGATASMRKRERERSLGWMF